MWGLGVNWAFLEKLKNVVYRITVKNAEKERADGTVPSLNTPG